ncbi:MAG TPA: Lrp/AsnC ligand binding domain-containing protein [Chloroflexota bacterium]|jgi:DNA-binding Lrp family transcriptional regulator|nr:Lrp/AsnC ligand binding domain-containing protein [Chloroflexota bacterium]
MITAIVLIHTRRGQTAAAGEALAEIPAVAEVYSVTGEYDLAAIVRVQHYEEMADVVPRHIAAVPGVTRTHTLMAFQHYSRHDLDRLWGIGLDTEPARGS